MRPPVYYVLGAIFVMWVMWCANKHLHRVWTFVLDSLQPWRNTYSTHNCFMFIIKSFTEHSNVIMSVGWDFKWCPVSRITTTLARKGFRWGVGSWGPPRKLWCSKFKVKIWITHLCYIFSISKACGLHIQKRIL